MQPTIIAVTGLFAEAKLARGPHMIVVSGGGNSQGLARALETAIFTEKKVSAIISFGIAGGLAPGLSPGTMLIARSIITPDGQRFATATLWSQWLAQTLANAKIVDLAGVDAPVTNQIAKLALYRQTRAQAVDMESHIAAKIAFAHGLPFAAFRVIADPAERHLPHAAQIGLRPNGKIAFAAVTKSILCNPRQIPHLWRTALDARTAFAALLSGRQMIEDGFGFANLG
jgi:adenosylhomocysteine nucleosidase